MKYKEIPINSISDISIGDKVIVYDKGGAREETVLRIVYKDYLYFGGLIWGRTAHFKQCRKLVRLNIETLWLGVNKDTKDIKNYASVYVMTQPPNDPSEWVEVQRYVD